MKYRVLPLVLLALLAVPAVAQRVMAPSRLDNTSIAFLTGNVVGIDGSGIRDARVELRDAYTGSVISSGYTMPNGSFTFTNVRPGQYELVATQGLQQSRERVDCTGALQPVTLRIASAAQASDGSATVSVMELKIPDKAKREFQKADEAFGKHKTADARAHCEKALAIAPTYSRALTLSGLLDLTDGKYDGAREKLEQAIKSDYSYGLAYVVLGATYNGMSRYDDALRTLDRAMPLVPTSWQAYFEMAKAQLGKGDYQRALASSDRAITLAPASYAPVHLVRAHALLGLKAYTDAVAELEKYLGGDPNGVDSANARKTLDQVKTFMATSRK